MLIPIVENPRRRRRVGYTAKQLAAGFGGKGRMAGSRRRRRYHNPPLMTLGNPRRRSRRHYAGSFRRRYHRRRNPAGLAGMFDVQTGLYVGAGILSTSVVPRLVARFAPQIPTTGLPGLGVKLASGFAASYVVKMFVGAHRAQQVMAGALGSVVVELANTYLLPKLGIAGLGDDELTAAEAESVLLDGYAVAPDQIAGVGAYETYNGAYAS